MNQQILLIKLPKWTKLKVREFNSGIIDWIEAKIADLRSERLFEEYFEGTELESDGIVYYLDSPKNGIGLVINNDFWVETIHLFSGKTNDGKTYSGLIPHNLSFTMSQAEIQSILGVPNRTGGGYIDITGPTPVWDKYYFHNHSVHLQYSPSIESIDLITIASLQLEPGLNAILQ